MTAEQLRALKPHERNAFFAMLDHNDQLTQELDKKPLEGLTLTPKQGKALCEFFQDGSGTGKLHLPAIRKVVHQQIINGQLEDNFLPLCAILIKSLLESAGHTERRSDGSQGMIHSGIAPAEPHPKDITVIGPGVGYPMVREDKA